MIAKNEDSGAGRRIAGAILVAAVGVAAYWWMFYSAGYQAGVHDRDRQTETRHFEQTARAEQARLCTGQPADRAKCAADIVARERENIRSESGLAAQWRSADWAMMAGIAALAQLLATIFGLYYIKGTLDATRQAVIDTSEATNEMREANRIAATGNRPWVKIDLMKRHAASLTADAFRLEHEVRLTNIGKNPASVRSMRLRARAASFTQKTSGSEELVWNEAPDKLEYFTTDDRSNSGTHILPDDYLDLPLSVDMRIADAFEAVMPGDLHAIMHALDINIVYELEGQIFRSSSTFMVRLTEGQLNGCVRLPANGKKKVDWAFTPMFREYE